MEDKPELTEDLKGENGPEGEGLCCILRKEVNFILMLHVDLETEKIKAPHGRPEPKTGGSDQSACFCPK